MGSGEVRCSRCDLPGGRNVSCWRRPHPPTQPSGDRGSLCARNVSGRGRCPQHIQTFEIYLENILLAFFYFVLKFLKLLRVERRVHFAVAFSRYGQLLLLAGRVVGFLCCFYLQGEGVPEHRVSESSKSWQRPRRWAKCWCSRGERKERDKAASPVEPQLVPTTGRMQQILTKRLLRVGLWSRHQGFSARPRTWASAGLTV